MKRIYLIALIALGLIVIAVALFLIFRSPSPEVTTNDPGNPFGVSNEPAGSVEAPPLGEAVGGAGEEVALRLTKITSTPVAYGTSVRSIRETLPATETASSTELFDTEIRYVERESGHIYRFLTEARTLTRLTNRTLPGVVEAAWTADGATAFARLLTETESGSLEVETFALPASGEGGYFLETGLSDIAVTGSTTLLTLLPNASGSVATVARVDGSSPRTLFTSLLSSLRILPAGPGYVAYTKASAQSNGYGFFVGGTSGTFERIAGPLRGLTMLPSPTGETVFYSFLSGSILRAQIIDTTSREVTDIPLGALPEKCTWSPDESTIYCAVPRSLSGTIPDDWYQGAVSFSDRIWKIDLEGRVAVLVVDPLTVAQVDIDAVALSVDQNETILVFTNKKDGSLWAYDL